MSKLVLSGDTSGSVTLDAPAVSGTTTLTLPATSGTILTSVSAASSLPSSINGPAFSAYQSSAQTPSANTNTKLQFQTEEFDTNSNFDNATNYRFTPTVAGYYYVNGALAVGSTACTMSTYIYKNGSMFKSGMQVPTSGIASVGALIYFNGSTDYVEMYASISVSQALNANLQYTYFQASMVRSA
jgi:hypothetical protein